MTDKFGPEYIVKVYNPNIGMKGFLVVDNTAFGPGKGGVRMTPNVTEEEVFRLARAMTWKNALAELPFGGAKSGIVWSGGSSDLKKKHIQSFALAIKPFLLKKYIAGPDVSAGEKEMKWFVEAAGTRQAATGKPRAMAGLPHELGSTGFGVAHSAAVTIQFSGLDIKKTKVAIEGFGNVGTFAFKHLQQMGARIVAVSDSKGMIFNEEGFDVRKLLALKKSGKSVIDYPQGQKFGRDAIFDLAVDVLIPASVTDVINEKNKNNIKAKIIVEGANIPMRENIEEELRKKGILIIPDFVANSGGVISSYAEYRGWGAEKMFELVKSKITKLTKTVLEESAKNKKSPREAALQIAQAKVEAKMKKKK